MHEKQRIIKQKGTRRIGLMLIAANLGIEGMVGLFFFANSLQHGDLSTAQLTKLTISIGGIVAATGLLAKRSFGRDLALVLSCFGLYDGFSHAEYYFAASAEITYLVKGLVFGGTALAILIYLSRKTIKDLFACSPLSLIVIGITSMLLTSVNKHSGDFIISSFWGMMWVVSFSYIIRGSRALRSSGVPTFENQADGRN